MALSVPLAIAHAATGGEPVAAEQVDVAPCLAAASVDDDDKVDAHCPAVIDSEKTVKTDRLKALIARGDHYVRRGMTDRAIADYSQALLLDPSLADIFNARGELWLRKYDRPKAVQDFGAALKLNPNHEKAKANHKALAQELERIGARMAIAGKPSFNCARARRAVEKAICADLDLAELDSDVQGSYVRAVREASNPRDKKLLQREQDAYIARRNAEFGRPGYDLKKAMLERLQQINGIDGY
ncbi:tetratricopeptide repeat protein [Bradyrhizobium liaoningense]|nr:tetratricopeptide repeat protein [Bradyrhizobium liaoningense]MBR0719757.1 tetratricopeptide repeat protein [Bradyrhizobium liaoningense]